MDELKNVLKYAKDNRYNAVDITQDSLKKPKNVYLFNHSIPESSKEALMIDDSIFWFPNIKSFYGAIIQNPQKQYIFCNELFDCVGLGGTIKDEAGQTHIFGAHVYESILQFQMQDIVNEFSKYGLLPDKVLYSPREDTGSWKRGQEVLERHFLETISVLRKNGNQAEMIVGIEGILLNNKFYEL